MTYPRICIVGLKCYDLLSGAETPRYIGGIENQLVLLARGLVEKGFPVSFVTFDHGQPDGIEHNGVRVYKAFDSNEGIPVIRFIHPRWTGLSSALNRANADIYYQMGAGCETGQVAMWCKKKNKHFVFATASDSNCTRDLPSLKSLREKFLYSYGLKKAEVVITQTEKQQQCVKKYFDVSSEMIRIFTFKTQNKTTELKHLTSIKRRRILWIGRICPEKRPHFLLEISRRLPEYSFDVLGDANAHTEYVYKFRQEAKNYPSIKLHGKVSYELLEKMYNECILLIGTSCTEGFPVTFIEAWSQGIPVISTFDPDGVISKYHLGWYVSSIEDFVTSIRAAITHKEMWQETSQAARSYYLENHTKETVLATYKNLFSKLTKE